MKTIKPNDFGKIILVEHCQKIKINDFLKNYRRKLKAFTIKVDIEAAGFKIDLTTTKAGFGGVRLWFLCPLCNRRKGTLFVHPVTGLVGCRTCLSLDYAKRRCKGMVEKELAIPP